MQAESPVPAQCPGDSQSWAGGRWRPLTNEKPRWWPGNQSEASSGTQTRLSKHQRLHIRERNLETFPSHHLRIFCQIKLEPYISIVATLIHLCVMLRTEGSGQWESEVHFPNSEWQSLIPTNPRLPARGAWDEVCFWAYPENRDLSWRTDIVRSFYI